MALDLACNGQNNVTGSFLVGCVGCPFTLWWAWGKRNGGGAVGFITGTRR